MYQLINLLNEYYETKPTPKTLSHYESEDGYFTDNMYEYVHESLVISKKFGFIQWLVENDKTLCINPLHGYSKTKRVLILLAIQDDPIGFLVSILK